MLYIFISFSQFKLCLIINHHRRYINLVSKIIYYLCFDHLDTEEKKTDIEIEVIMEPVGDAQIVVEEEIQSASNQKWVHVVKKNCRTQTMPK